MAYDDIVKALTIQITADDLTGGMWSSVGKGVKTVWDNVTALNQAWELGAKAYGVLADALETPVAILSAGGEYSEAEAGFRSLADSYKVDGEKIVNAIREISDGSVGLMEATQAASNAIKKGFSSDQIIVITEFSKKFSDVVGGDFLQIMADVERGLATGQTKLLKQYDIAIEKGMSMSQVLALIAEKTKSMGEGAFNFGDKWAGMLQSVNDAFLTVYKFFNDFMGENGFGEFADSFRESVKSVEKFAAPIATAIFIPIRDIVLEVLEAIKSVKSTASSIFFWMGDGVGSLGVKIVALATLAGTVFYNTAIYVKEQWNFITSPINAFFKTVSERLEGFLDSFARLGEYFGTNSKTLDMIKEAKLQAHELSKIDILGVDTLNLKERQTKFYEMIDGALVKMKTVKKEVSTGLVEIGQAYKDTDKIVEKSLAEQERYNNSKASQAVALKRRIEDIEQNHADALANIARTGNKDQKKIAEENIRYQEALRDAKLSNTRKIEDIETDHQKKMKGLQEQSINGIKTYYGRIAQTYEGFAVQYGGLTPTSFINGNMPVWEFDGKGNQVTKTSDSTSSTTKQNALNKGSSGSQVIKVEVAGKDGALKELIEEIIERVTTKAIAEGLITAGV